MPDNNTPDERKILSYDPMTGIPIYAPNEPEAADDSDDPTLGDMLATLDMLSPPCPHPTAPEFVDADQAPEAANSEPQAALSPYTAAANEQNQTNTQYAAPQGAQPQYNAPQSTVPAAKCAGFFTRLAAFALDSLVAWVMGLVVAYLVGLLAKALGFSGMDDAVLFSITVRNIVTYLVGALYFVLLTGFTGRTLGKMLLRIQVVRADGGKAGWWDVVYRETIGRYLSSLLCIGYLVLAFDPEHRGFHDMLCDTRVVLC